MAVGACSISFDMTNPYARNWARMRSASQIADITASARLAIRRIIERSFAEGIPHRQAARLLRSVIGLTEAQAEAVANLRIALISSPGKTVSVGTLRIRVPMSGLSESALQAKLDKYAERLLNRRAYVIARHETMSAANVGQRQLWDQAMRDQLLDPEMEKIWIYTPDTRFCDECEALGNEEPIPYSDYFSNGLMGPPGHVLCRCTEGLVMPGTERKRKAA